MNKSLLLALSFLAAAGVANAGDVSIKLESPVNGTLNTGIDTLYGWAVSTAGIDRVDLYIDGELFLDLPYGGTRQDVAAQFPDISDAEFSGFSGTFPYVLLEPGSYEIKVTAVDNDGDSKSRIAMIDVAEFSEDWVTANQVDMSDATFMVQGQTLQAMNVSVAGQSFDVTLEWMTSGQRFQVTGISPVTR